MANAVELAIRVSADASDASAGLDRVGDSATRMAGQVDTATRMADQSASRFDGVADSADNMASSSSQAAGGLGDLGGALALMPGPLGAVGGGMEALAPAIMGVTGASDLLNLVTKSTIVMQTRARVSAIAHAVASRTVAAATRVWSAGQWLLNAALSANPIGIVVVAVAALVAGIILAYNKSETFRRIVDTVMALVRGYINTVIDVITNLIEFVRDRAPGAFNDLKAAGRVAFEVLTTPIRTVYNLIQDIIGAVQSLIEWIGKIDFPDIPDIPGFRLGTGDGSGVGLPVGWRTVDGGTGDNVIIQVPALSALTPNLIRQLVRALNDYYRDKGKRVQLVSV